MDRSVFRFQDGTLLGDSDGIDRYEPVSVGISTVGNGGNGSTWINIATGYTQGVTDSVTNYPQLTDKDENGNAYTVNPSLPYQDSQLPIFCGGPAGGYTYQTIILDRTQPSVVLGSSCSNSVSEMVSDVNSQLASEGKPALNDPQNGKDYLVVFGTTPGNFAIPGLDTTAFGGTDYTTSQWGAGSYPWYYTIIGVPGAKSGSAQESYLRPDAKYTFFPSLNGTLASDGTYYNYVAAGELPFHVISGAPGTPVDSSHPCGTTASPNTVHLRNIFAIFSFGQEDRGMARTVAGLPAGSRITDYVSLGRDREVFSGGESARGIGENRTRQHPGARFAGPRGGVLRDCSGFVHAVLVS